ncbi:Glutamyl-tRNA synthetase @ Glutamyl-tRNA(Gln) synthetase, partial [hydrothermal vent metagenome]
TWDELYYQSDRFDLYKKYAQNLLDEGKAYKDGDAVILTMPKEQIKLYDLIRGEITFDSDTLKDQVLIKSDGSPTYSFACVLDDALMEISHVIRGEDHISNTPKQIVIYQALGMKPPKYAHLPLIMGEDGGRMSKRTGAVAVTDYREQGFLSQAIVNYLMLLGWAPGNNQEIISLEAAVKKFSIKKINKAGAIFSMDKLKWVNGQYIKSLSSSELMSLIEPVLQKQINFCADFNSKVLENVVNLYKERLSTLNDFLDWTGFIFLEELKFDPGVKKEHLKEEQSEAFGVLAEKFSSVEEFNAKNIEEAFRKVVEKMEIKVSDLVHPIRVALTGKAVGPNLFEAIAVLGKEKTLKRLGETFSDS